MFYKTEKEWNAKGFSVKEKAKSHFHNDWGVPKYNRFQVKRNPLAFFWPAMGV